MCWSASAKICSVGWTATGRSPGATSPSTRACCSRRTSRSSSELDEHHVTPRVNGGGLERRVTPRVNGGGLERRVTPRVNGGGLEGGAPSAPLQAKGEPM